MEIVGQIIWSTEYDIFNCTIKTVETVIEQTQNVLSEQTENEYSANVLHAFQLTALYVASGIGLYTGGMLLIKRCLREEPVIYQNEQE